MSDIWIVVDKKTKSVAYAILELLQNEKLSMAQFQILMEALPDLVYENTIITKESPDNIEAAGG